MCENIDTPLNNPVDGLLLFTYIPREKRPVDVLVLLASVHYGPHCSIDVLIILQQTKYLKTDLILIGLWV